MGAYKCDVVVVIKMGAYICSWGAYFVWVLIIPILQYFLHALYTALILLIRHFRQWNTA